MWTRTLTHHYRRAVFANLPALSLENLYLSSICIANASACSSVCRCSFGSERHSRMISCLAPTCFISPSPSALDYATLLPLSSTGRRGCGPLQCCASSALPSRRHLCPSTPAFRRRSSSSGVHGGLPIAGIISSPSRARQRGPSFRCLSNLVLQVVRLVIAAELA